MAFIASDPDQELSRQIAALSRPAAYPFPVDAIEVHQTHISVVFLAGAFAYKVKKPVAMGFLDFRTPESRHHFCTEEVRLNRRLAPEVYLGVVPVTADGDTLRLEGTGAVRDWAVKMVRLPASATLESHLRRGEVDAGLLEELARRVGRFHADAERGGHIAAWGRYEVVAENARDNFAQSAGQVGLTVTEDVFARLRTLTEESLSRLRPLIESRAARGVPCDTHGDLHLEHVYLFPGQPPPGDLVLIDCIEFNERFRFADPVSDMAFLVMDLKFHGHRELARAFADEYFRASGDEEGRALLPFYTAYRAMVRGKVEGFAQREKEIPEQERRAALQSARSHWLLALDELEPAQAHPLQWVGLRGGLPNR